MLGCSAPAHCPGDALPSPVSLYLSPVRLCSNFFVNRLPDVALQIPFQNNAKLFERMNRVPRRSAGTEDALTSGKGSSFRAGGLFLAGLPSNLGLSLGDRASSRHMPDGFSLAQIGQNHIHSCG